MKIFKFYWKDVDATDWVYAHDKEDAEDFYLGFTQCGDLEGCVIRELPEEEWSTTFITDINEAEPDPDEVDYDEDDYCCGFKIQESFAEYAKRNSTTDMIATTEF